MQNGKLVRWVVVVVLAGGAGWWFWGAHKAAPEAGAQVRGSEAGSRRGNRAEGGRPVPVLVAPVGKADLPVVQTAVGTVVSSAVVTVRSRVNGQLVRVLFREGQPVRAGDVLAEIDPRPFQAQLAQVQGQALRNQALLRNSQIDLERYRTLQSQDSIAAQQVDAQASLVQQYQGTVQADQGLVDNARLQLGFTRIISPISGRIGLRQVDVGNNIASTDALAVVNAVDPIHVVFTLPEDRASGLVRRLQAARKSGRSLPVEAWDRGNTALLARGSLQSIDNQIDPTSGTIKLKAQFSNADGLLFPNQFVNVRLLSDTLQDVTVAPNAAIQRGSAGAFVYLLARDGADAKVTVRQVRPGALDGDRVAIEQGLAPGDEVVVSGIDKLRDGAKVLVSGGEAGDRRHGRPGDRPEGRPGRRGNQPGGEAPANTGDGRNRRGSGQFVPANG